HREPAEVPPLLRRRLQGRVPRALGQAAHPRRGRRRAVSAPDPAGDARREGPEAGAGRRADAGRPALPRPRAVPRILPRRHGAGPGRQPPDGLDGALGQPAAAVGALGDVLALVRVAVHFLISISRTLWSSALMVSRPAV